MPYATIGDLPSGVRHHLPRHGQEIFRAAFNTAFHSYQGDPRQEEVAHRIAWAAVKRQYHKVGDHWLPSDGADRSE
jgi:cation transport regulator